MEETLLFLTFLCRPRFSGISLSRDRSIVPSKLRETIQEKLQCGSFSICFPHRSTAAVETNVASPAAM
jgi:hypothetical protein